ncbi:MAG TPA: IS21 family transposase, partial [Thermoleophilaceae bacterium]|nr:IS21 family transposase [Thermoleophilaceae bacterium]
MIAEELRSRIRRMFFAEHWKVGTIAAELGVHHETVALAIEMSCFTNKRWRQGASALDPFKGFIEQTLKEHPKLRATRLHEMIKLRGFEGSAVQVRRYARLVRPVSRREAFLRLATLPGEQAQVDWGCFGRIEVGRAKRQLSCFVLVLSWSRALFARFFLDQTLESFLRGHVLAFETLGGVPRGLLYDNLKSVVLERQGDLIRFHPRLLELAGHYCFAPKPCAPARGNEKGRVERAIQYLRHSFFAARRFSSVEDLNAQLADWIERVAHARRVPGDPDKRLIRETLDDERARLLPLPQHRFPCDLVRPTASGKTPYIRFDLNDYSIPHTLVQKPLTLIASEDTVRIVDGEREVARHVRSYDRQRQIEETAHLEALAEQKRAAHELRGRDRLRAVCPRAEAFLDAVALRGGHLGGTTSRLLRLLDHHGAPALDTALNEALARGAPSAGSVGHLLDQSRRKAGAPPPLDAVLP